MNLPNISHESEEFLPLCHKLRIEFPSTIHHFIQHGDGTYTPVIWSNIKPETRESER